MNIIIPMAGMGKRLRPHTLTIPKPLIPIAGRPIVQWLVTDIVKLTAEKVDNIGFVISRNFGEKIEDDLLKIASELGSNGKIYYQDEPLGTAHAIYCAKELLDEKTIVAFADTLFQADFILDTEKDAIIWVQQVEDPSQFGVIQLNDEQEIIDFVEKPREKISDLAIIGIYYFKHGSDLKREIAQLIRDDLKDSGEYQLTRVLKTLQKKGTHFYPGRVDKWLDCGNKVATVETHKAYLGFIKENNLISSSAKITNSVVIPPVYLGENVQLNNSVIGPFVSIGENSKIFESRVQNSIIQNDNHIKNANLANSMLGNFVTYEGKTTDLSVGDYNTIYN